MKLGPSYIGVSGIVETTYFRPLGKPRRRLEPGLDAPARSPKLLLAKVPRLSILAFSRRPFFGEFARFNCARFLPLSGPGNLRF